MRVDRIHGWSVMVLAACSALPAGCLRRSRHKGVRSATRLSGLGPVFASRRRWPCTSLPGTAVFRCSVSTKTAASSASAMRKRWSDPDLANKRVQQTRQGGSLE